MWWFVAGAFVVPLGLLVAALATGASWLPAAAFVVQYGGLLAERWFFLAQSRHPQNLYYQAVS
jgi:DMSO reductase anchor subunit